MILACDPGLKGAFAWSDDVTDMPVYVSGKTDRARIDAAALHALICRLSLLGCDTLVIEDVNGAPGQSAPAAFSFGRGVGLVTAFAMAQGMAIEPVAPSVWKRALRVPADKRASRARASELLPAMSGRWPLQKHDGRAEAAMLKHYAERFLQGSFA